MSYFTHDFLAAARDLVHATHDTRYGRTLLSLKRHLNLQQFIVTKPFQTHNKSQLNDSVIHLNLSKETRFDLILVEFGKLENIFTSCNKTVRHNKVALDIFYNFHNVLLTA